MWRKIRIVTEVEYGAVDSFFWPVSRNMEGKNAIVGSLVRYSFENENSRRI
jgi:hypothetical protein